jgi:type I restriction enzyme S subunit
MASEWRSSTWGDEISLEYGKSLRGYDATRGEYRVFGSNGPIGWTREPLAPGPGVILGRKGAYRGVQYSPEPFYVIDTAYYVVPKTELDMRWLYYAIRHYKLGDVDDGSPIPSTTRSAVYVLDLDVPPPDEQRAIGHILGTLDDKIALNRRMNETLGAMARALFKSWFVDFDPVRAKSEGRELRLSPHVAAQFPDSFVDSGLGQIPHAWRIVPISELAVVVGGTTPTTKVAEFWEDGRNYWVTPKDLSALATPVLLGTERRITDSGLAQIGSGLLPTGTVLLSSRAPIGYLAITEVPVAINQGFIALRPVAGVSNLFLLYWADWALDEILSRANGSTFLEISKSNFRPIPVAAPPQQILALFDQMTRPLYSRIVVNELETRLLSSLRDTLQPMLISGDLRIQDAKHALGGGT